MAFHGHHHVFSQPHTILTINSLTPALRLNTQPANIPPNTWRSSHVRCVDSSQTSNSTEARRSANYHPNIWDYEFVESLNTDYKSEICTKRAEKLKENVTCMFVEASGSSYSLKLIDFIQRLGLDYHFHNEIKSALDKIYMNGKGYHVSQNDHLSFEALKFRSFEALKFRLFRQHGYEISQDIFKSFIENSHENKGKVKDVEGLLSLYEASFYAYEGEKTLLEAQQITSKHLNNYLKERNDDKSSMSIFFKEEIAHSLELPLLWRLPRMEVPWYINVYEMNQDMHPSLLEFAKLDFNMVQATYHEDLKYVSRWWKDLGLHESLGFARHRLVESFLWCIGCNSGLRILCYDFPLFLYSNQSQTVIDDIYDVYGSLDELKIFTEAIQRWDINTVENLPHYLKICYFALYNTVNEVGYEVLRSNNLDVMPYLKKSWEDICKSYLVEATWYYSDYTPRLEEYTNNAWTSVAGPLLSIHAYCQLGDHETITKEALERMSNNKSTLIRWSSMILRLADDLGTSKDELERGDVAKSIQCYMHETGVSEAIAREHIKYLISASWTKMNTSLSSSRGVFPSSFINIIQNIARTAQYIYQYGDGHGIPHHEAKDRIMSIIVKPIPM